MKAALIPPIPHLKEFGTGPLHLLLAHLFEDASYVKHYKAQRAAGAYLILDNSAHEFTEGASAEELAAYARVVQAQEVVVPDVLDNGPLTVARAVDALEQWFEGGANLMGSLNPTLMYVPQGAARDEYYSCMDELISLHRFVARRRHVRRNFVLGISKDYEDFPGGLHQILVNVEETRDKLAADDNIQMNVHILGWHRNLWVLGDLARKFPWIRSTDSCKPFQYAMRNIQLWRDHDPPTYPGRHATEYFQTRLPPQKLRIARSNALVFTTLAAGKI